MPPRRQIAHGMVSWQDCSYFVFHGTYDGTYDTSLFPNFQYDKSGSKVVSFADFYDIDTISKRQQGLDIITMEQFLEREGLNGHLKSKLDGSTIYPPENQIRWDNRRLDPLWKYIRNVTKTFQWNPKQCVSSFHSNISLPFFGCQMKSLYC